MLDKLPALTFRKERELKTLKGLNKDNKEALKFVLETATTKTITVVKDLRQIDKICKLLEEPVPDNSDISLEDEDYNFLKKRFDAFDQWNPTAESRSVILDTADKLNA